MSGFQCTRLFSLVFGNFFTGFQSVWLFSLVLKPNLFFEVWRKMAGSSDSQFSLIILYIRIISAENEL